MPEFDMRDSVEDLVIILGRIRQVGLMYGEGHRIAKEAVGAGYATLEKILTERGEVTIGIIGDEIACEKEPFYEASIRIGEFIGHLKGIGMKKISFVKGMDMREFSEFARVLSMKADAVTKNGGAQKILKGAGVTHITTGELGFGGEKGEEELINDLTKQNYENGINFLEKAYEDIKGNKKLNVHSARQIVSGMICNIIKNKDLLLVLTSVKGRDENLFAHGMNVAVFTLMQAEFMGLTKETMVDVGMAALLHDVGKIAAYIQDEEDDMSEEGIRKSAMHDVMGAKMLLETEGISPLAAVVAFEHNIKYDMSGGGPKKLYGDELNFATMVIAISSYYDRLRRKPSYNLDGGPEKAYDDMMKMSGKDFHPDVLNNFFSLVGVFPPGTLVELDNGEVALVVQSSLIDKKRPQVEILYGPDGEKYADPKLANLLEKDEKGRFKWNIVKSISKNANDREIYDILLKLNEGSAAAKLQNDGGR